MVPPAMVATVQRLLNEGAHSYRKISKMTRISRGVIQDIAKGRRPDYEALRRERQADRQEATGPAARCPTCGNRVFLPCRECWLQVQVERQRSNRKFRALWTNPTSKLPARYAAELKNWRAP
jgi:hypothetical protein